MKRLLVVIFLGFLFFSPPHFVWAQNKCGVNIGPRYEQVEQVAQLTKSGGWVVSLGSPGNCSDFESLFGRNLNVVIRAYNGGQPFTQAQALGWVATLGQMETQGQKIYFMPWNEPNHELECGHRHCSPEEVISYVQYLKDQLAAAGLLGTKVVLLSPMVDKLNPTFDSFRAVYNLGLPSSINEYDQALGQPYQPCRASPTQNNCLYDQIGLPGPYFALEAGVAGTCLPPCYRDNELSLMLNEVWSAWQKDNFKMFAIFSYDPHRSGWDLFSAPQTRNFYQTHCSPGTVESGQFDANQFQQWFEQHQNQLVNCNGCGYAPSKEFCTAAGTGTTITEPQIIEPEQSLVCTDFNIGQSAPVENPWLELVSQRLPDFSKLEAVINQLLSLNLPAKLKRTLKVSENPLETRAKHFVGQVPPANPPQTKITFPSLWTRLLAKSRILCAIFGQPPVCEPTSVKLEIAQPDPEQLANSLSPHTSCANGNIPAAEIDLNTQTLSSFFPPQTTAFFPNRTREFLVGGASFVKQSALFDSQLPADFNLNFSPLGGAAQFSLAPGLSASPGAEKINYQNLGLARARYCLYRCSEYSQKYLEAKGGISALDPLCPSCRPEDYLTTGSSSQVIEYPPPNQACSADAPHEIIPSCAQCGDILFCWGNNYRLCETDPQIPAPALGSRNSHWWFSPSDFPTQTVLYNGSTFPVPSGGIYVCDANVFGCANERCR